jgi:hypothetical protein
MWYISCLWEKGSGCCRRETRSVCCSGRGRGGLLQMRDVVDFLLPVGNAVEVAVRHGSCC